MQKLSKVKKGKAEIEGGELGFWSVPDSENYVLHSVLEDSEKYLDVVISLLEPKHFKHGRNWAIFNRIVELRNKGIHVDLMSVTADVVKMDDFDEQRREHGFSYSDVTDLSGNYQVLERFDVKARMQSVRAHCSLIREAYSKTEVMDAVKRGDLDDARRSLSENPGYFAKFGLQKFLDNSLEHLDEPEAKTLKHPYSMFNVFLGEMVEGSFVVVAGRPSAGKSVVCQDYLLSAMEQGKRVLFASAEMDEKMMRDRLLTAVSGKDLKTIRKTNFDEFTRHYTQAVADLSEMGGDVTFIFSSKIADIEAAAREGQFDVLIVDYLQFLTPVASYKGDYERVSAISRELVHIARKMALTTIVAAQINRHGDDAQPAMADIKGSGQIEQDADVLITLWRNKDEIDTPDTRIVRVDCLKNRNGEIFYNSKAHVFGLQLEKKLYRFKSLVAKA